MKTPKLEPKRRRAGRLIFRRVHARTARRQRAATAAESAGDLAGDVPNVGVARALLIILGLHLVAIAGIFVHNHYFDSDPGGAGLPGAAAAVPAAADRAEPMIGPEDDPYVVQPGDTYARVSERHGVAEDDLRRANSNVPLRSGRILRIPPRRIVAVESPELARRRANARDVVPPAAAVLVRPAAARRAAAPVAAAAGESYVVQAGDSVWRIATRFGVRQEELMKANGIDDPRKMRAGMKLRIPAAE